MRRGHRGIQQLLDLDAPVIVACKGWAIGGSFQRALLCDIRIAAEGARFMLPEVDLRRDPRHRRRRPALPDVRPRRRQRHGAHRPAACSAEEALAHGVVSRVVPADELDATAREMAEQIAAAPAVTVKMARRVIRHLAEPRDPRVDGRRADLPDVHQPQSTTIAELRAARAEDRDARATRGAEPMTDRPSRSACPSRPPLGAHGAAGRHLRRRRRVRHRRRHRPRQGHRHRVRPPRRRPSSIASRKPEHLDAGRDGDRGARRARSLTVACDIRDPEQIAAAFDARRGGVRPARRAGQQRGRQLPGAGRGHVAQRVAHRRRHHAQRHVLLRPRVRPPPPRRRHAGLDRQRRRVVRVDRRARLRPLAPRPRPA